jgi:hypothetical protein
MSYVAVSSVIVAVSVHLGLPLWQPSEPGLVIWAACTASWFLGLVAARGES